MPWWGTAAQGGFFVLLGLALGTAASRADRRWPGVLEWYWAGWMVLMTVLAAVRFAAGRWTWGVVDAAEALVFVWLWWMERKRRKRRRVLALAGAKSRARIVLLVRRQAEAKR